MKSNTPEKVFIGLGSNVGNRMSYLKSARREIRNYDCRILRESSVFESEAWGYTEQDHFLNQVIKIETERSPEDLLLILKKIERDIGRKQRGEWQEREIDLDILLYGQRIIETPALIIPHRYMTERKFVLIPLAEIAGEEIDPRSGNTLLRLLESTPDESVVYKYNI